MSQQQSPDNVSVDEIPVDIDNTQSGEVDSADVPDEIESITRGLAGEQPPTNPLVVLKAARWWYIHGKGGTDPVFQWAIEWARHLATGTPSDVDRFDEFLFGLPAVQSSFAVEQLEDAVLHPAKDVLMKCGPAFRELRGVPSDSSPSQVIRLLNKPE